LAQALTYSGEVASLALKEMQPPSRIGSGQQKQEFHDDLLGKQCLSLPASARK
jgi:hypothetical protein